MVKEIIDDMAIRWLNGRLLAFCVAPNGGTEIVVWNGSDWEVDDIEELYNVLTANPASDQRLIAHGVIKPTE